MKESGAGTLVASELLSTISSARMHSARWNGTRRDYILSWQDNVRRYNALVPPSEQLTKPFLKTMLQNLVQGVPELNALKTDENMDILRGKVPLSYSQYSTLLSDKCDLLDSSNFISLKTRRMSLSCLTQVRKDYCIPSGAKSPPPLEH